MFKKFFLFCSLVVLGTTAALADAPRVVLQTSLGEIELELNQQQAPVSVANFLEYVDKKSYDGTIFHRVIPGFMVQGGGFDRYMQKKPTGKPIQNEANNGLKNERGTIAMARTQAVNSATMQFFINHADNDFLNHSKRDFGYAVFGKVVRGMDVVDEIARQKTSSYGMHQDVPVEPIIIKKARRSK